MGLLAWLVVGLLVGAVARLFVRGSGLGCVGTIVLGLVGSVVGGSLLGLLLDGDLEIRTTGFIGSVIGAVVVLVVAQLFSDRGSRRTRR